MRNPMARLVLIGGLILGSHAYAGVEHGNGGGVVVCADGGGHVVSVELLDFYEQRVALLLARDMGPSDLDYKAKVHYALDRHKDIAPFRTAYWGEQVDRFDQDAVFISDARFDRLDDTGRIVIPNGCTFEQAVIQQEPQMPRERRYKVNKDIWDRLDEDNKAGLVLHEIIYREAIRWGHMDSIATRYLNAVWTAAGDLEEFESLEAVNNFLRQAKFGSGEAYGCSPLLFSLNSADKPMLQYPKRFEYYGNGVLKNVFYSLLVATARLETPYGWITADCGINNFSIDTAFELHEDGKTTQVYSAASGHLVGEAFELDLLSQPSSFRTGFGVDGTTYYLLRGDGEARVQDQTLRFSGRLSVRADTPWIMTLEGVYSAFRLRAAGDKWYVNGTAPAGLLVFDDQGLVTRCDGCTLQN